MLSQLGTIQTLAPPITPPTNHKEAAKGRSSLEELETPVSSKAPSESKQVVNLGLLGASQCR